MDTHGDRVQQQFDPQAEAYLHSAVHARGPDLARARELVVQARIAGVLPAAAHALDVGCGAGHLSFALASVVGTLVALDPSPQMCATVARAAAERGHHNIGTCEAGAERLPFADRSFDLVCTRYSAHHWLQLEQALSEMHRVLRPGGCWLVIDLEGPAHALVDTHLQALELLRDGSHVRNRSVAEWRAALAASGFAVQRYEHWPLRLEFAAWVERMRTPPGKVAMIRALQQEAPAEVRDALAIDADGNFSVQTALFWGQPMPA